MTRCTKWIGRARMRASIDLYGAGALVGASAIAVPETTAAPS